VPGRLRTLPLLLVDLGNTSVGVALLTEHGADARRSGGSLGHALRPVTLTRAAFGVAGFAAPGGGFDAFVAHVAWSTRTFAPRAAPSSAGPVVDPSDHICCFVSSVQRPAVAAEIGDVLRRHGLGPARVNVPSGLVLALRNPETCGFDRQYAARAALARAPGPALVVSAGTALTVDAVVPWGDPRGLESLAEVGQARAAGTEPAAAEPVGIFLGGTIAPGPRLIVEALARGGARLFEVDGLDAHVPALGRDSAAALRSGVVHGFGGAARALVERVGAEAGLDAAPIWLSGGAAPLVREALTAAFGARVSEAPALVLEGLAGAAEVADPLPGEVYG
jgi:type III pantothenate kinase